MTDTNEQRVFPDEEGKCPSGYHNMPADDEHDREWCMDGESHPSESDSDTYAKNPKRETRMFHDVRMSEAQVDGDDSPTITGYAAVFNSLSGDLGGFVEKIDRGAFAQSLADGDEVHALYNHSDDKLLGRRGAGTLKVWEDDKGLRFEIDPPNTSDGNDVVELLRRGDLVSMSFGFFDVVDTWEHRDGQDVRTINSARLFDVSVVTNPAYEGTSVSVRCEAALESLEAFRADQVVEKTDFNAIGETLDLRLKLRMVEENL